MDLFEYQAQKETGPLGPLADRVRPGRLAHFVGQTHVVGRGMLVRSKRTASFR